MKEENKSGQHKHIPYSLSPARLLIVIFSLVFIIEVFIMIVLSSCTGLSKELCAVIDASVLTVLLFPALYFLVFHPLASYIEERNKAEDALREGERFLRQITDGLPILIAYVDNEERYRFVNKEYELWFKMPASHIIGKSVLELIGEANYKTIKKHIDDALSGEFVHYEDMLLKKKKKKYYIEAKYIPDRDKQGNVNGYFLMAQDITERKWAEETIVKLTHHKDLILESVGEGIFVLDSEGKSTFANSTAAKLLGYQVSELIGEKHHDRVHHTKKNGTPFPQAECPIYATCHDGISHKGVEIFWRKDGLGIPVEYRSTPIMEKGELKGAVVSFFDITDLQSLTQEIEVKYRQLEESLKEKEVLLREIHHRVKNNLQIVSSLLKLQSSHVDDGKVKDVFRDSQNRLRTMALIHEKLYQSRDLSRIDFAEYLRSLAQEIYTAYGVSQNHIALQLSVVKIFLGVDSAIPCGLIVSELLSNCLKYAFPDDRGGKISIDVKTQEDNELEIIISDNGVGVPESVDFRSTHTLGLQLVTILVEDQLNGKIVLERNHGTTFRITFKIMGKE
jgi:PAS domain S-box-containing protein